MDMEDSTAIVEIVALLIFAGFVAWRIIWKDIPYFLSTTWITLIVIPTTFGIITIGTAIYRYTQGYERGHVREIGTPPSNLRLIYSLLLGLSIIIFTLIIAFIWALITI